MLSNHVWCLNSNTKFWPHDVSHVFHGSTEVPHQVLIEARFHVQPTSTSVLRQQGSAPPHLEEGLGTMWEPCGDSLCFLGLHICVFLWFWCVFLEVLICFQVLFWRVLRVLPGAKMVPSEDVTPSTSSSESTKDSPSPRFLSSLRSYSKKMDFWWYLPIEYLLHYLHIQRYICIIIHIYIYT